MKIKKLTISSIWIKRFPLLWRGRGERWIIIPLLLVLSTVFVVSSDLANGVVSGKYFWFYASMGLVSVTTLIYSIFRKSELRFSVMDGLILLFAGSVYISSFIVNDASLNTTKLTILTLLVIWYFCLRIVYPTTKSPKGDLGGGIIILTGLVEAIWGLRQLYGFEQSQHSLFKLTGSFFNPGPYAGYLAVVLPLALYFTLKGKYSMIIFKHRGSRSWFTGLYGILEYLSCNIVKLISIITCIVVLLVLPAAMSRASWIAAGAGCGIVAFAYFSKKYGFKTYYKNNKKKILSGIVVGGCMLCVAFVGMYFLKKDSADGRAFMWKIGIQTVLKHPFGVGLGNFSGAYGDVQAGYFALGKGSGTEEFVAGNPEYAFNEYLQIAIESGVVSLILFLSIIGLAISNLIKAEKYGLLGSLVAILVFSLFSYPFSILPFLIIFVSLVAIGNFHNKWHTDNINNSEYHDSLKKIVRINPCHLCAIVIAGIGLFLSCFCLYTQYPVYKAYEKWNNEKIYYNAGLYHDVAEDYKQLYPLLNDQIQFLFEYAQSLSKSEQYEESNQVLQRATRISCDPMLYNIMGKNYQSLKEYDKAEQCLIKASQIVPNRIYPYYLLMLLYEESGQMEKMKQTALIVMEKEPKVDSQAVKEMREKAKKTLNN